MNKFEDKLTEENFMNYILELEKENLNLVTKADKKDMVYKIEKCYEEAKKRDNK